MHRYTVTRSWGLLLCHSSTTITSCYSMIMHCPMLQGSVHNSWKLKTSQFLHGQHTHRTCHPLSMFEMLWTGIYDSVFQFLAISSNFAQPLKRSGPTFHRPQSTTWSTLCEGDVLHCIEKVLDLWVQLMKNGGKNKCCVYNFVQCIYRNLWAISSIYIISLSLSFSLYLSIYISTVYTHLCVI